MKDTQLAIPPENQVSLVPREPSVAVSQRGVQLSSLDDMYRFAAMVVSSKMAPRDFQSAEAVLIAMQHGMELGLSPMQSIHSIAVINGRPGIYGDAALAICKTHPHFKDIQETFERGKTDDEMLAKCVVERSGNTPVTRTFSVAQAKKASLWGKTGPWTQYPQRMLQMRARSWALRDSFPDCLKGIGIREEVDDIPAANARELPAAPADLKFADEPPSDVPVSEGTGATEPEEAERQDKTALAGEDLFK